MSARPRRNPRWARRLLGGAASALVAPWIVLGGLAALTPVPGSLDAPPVVAGESENSVRFTDRQGVTLGEARDAEGKRARRVSLDELGAPIQRAIIAAEDTRFYAHPGVDPISMTRALWTSLLAGRVVSGASTLTQQLARELLGAERTVRRKIDVMALALKLEATFTKRRILEEYLNRIDFGPNTRGAEAAARAYFGKPAKSLSLGEAAALASIPRGPSLYDPQKNPTGLKARRDRVLDRMREHGLAGAEEVQRAKAEALVVGGRVRVGSAPHFLAALQDNGVDPCRREALALPQGAAVVKTTLVADLQREVELAARATVRSLEDKSVSAAAVVILANDTGDVLAYVGAPDAADVDRLGGNDGVLAKRQPGSTLKPFIYALAMDKLGMTPATMLPDVEMSFMTGEGEAFRPRNYDRQFHGPVLLREALGNSFNVPAVWTTERLGPTAVVQRLREVGFCSLSKPASVYGVGIALGDGEVTLMELATAYASLARGGARLQPRAVLEIELADGARQTAVEPRAPTESTSVATTLVTDILSDPTSRASAFGESTVFDLPFSVAAKTGTSKGFRDNWAVGYTPEVTVAVWVGNFNGSPMRDVSGIAGAGPLFRASMLAAAHHFPPTEFERPDADRVEICPLSGELPGPSCPHHRGELVPHGARLGTCALHISLPIDTRTDERAGAACKDDVEERTFEAFPPLLQTWAHQAKRPLAPSTFSERCPGKAEASKDELRIVYPEDGARFYLSDDASSQIVPRATSKATTFLLDDHPIEPKNGTTVIALQRGNHTLVALEGDRRSSSIHFTVE